MGYSYSMEGRLCCDACPAERGVRKRKCPYGYCPAPAVCKACWESGERERSARYHKEAGCKESHEAYQAKEAACQALLAAGKAVRSAAVGLFDGTGMVKVWFKKVDGSEEVYLMHEAVYEAHALGENTTPEDYAKHGTLTAVAE